MLKLEDAERGRLLALKNGPGYGDLLNLMEQICDQADLELRNLNRASGATNEQVLSAQDQARAFRACCQSIIREIENETLRFIEGQQRSITPALEEEFPGTPSHDEVLGINPRTN